MNNAIKHANASLVTVSLKTVSIRDADSNGEQSEVIRLAIRDNGVGFQTGSLGKERMGLGIMGERARAIDADLDISSGRGEGTRVTLIWKKNQVLRENL